MRKKILLLLCSFLICGILAGVRTANAGTSTIAVYPPSQDIAEPGILFTVNFTIINAPTMTQYIINNITWNPNVVELETGTKADFVEGPYLKAYGGTVWLIQPPDNVAGYQEEVSAAFLMDQGPASPGDGVLFTIKFRSKAVGSCDIHTDVAYILNGLNLVDTSTLEDGSVIVIPEFPASMIVPLFLILTTTIAVMAKIVWSRRRREHIDFF